MRRFPPQQQRAVFRHATSWNQQRDRVAQARFRRAVLNAAGHQCQAIEHGKRCTIIHPLQAHHTQAGNDDPTTGVALCPRHHRQIDSNAR